MNYRLFGLLLTSLVLVPAQSGERGVTPQVSFEQAVCDLGQVGVGTGNLCEFRFGNDAGYLRSNQGSCEAGVKII